jgi:pullulanase
LYPNVLLLLTIITHILLSGCSDAEAYGRIVITGSSQVSVGESSPLGLTTFDHEGISASLASQIESCRATAPLQEAAKQAARSPFCAEIAGMNLTQILSKVKWSAQNSKIVKVEQSATGAVITGLTRGQTYVTAAFQGITSRKLITVTELPQNVVRIHYHRFDGERDWGMFIWNVDDHKPAIDLAATGAGDWNKPLGFTASDDFGQYADIKVIDITNGANIIIKKGDNKDRSDRILSRWGEREFWIIEGVDKVFTSKPVSYAVPVTAQHTAFDTIKITMSSKPDARTRELIEVMAHDGSKVPLKSVTQNEHEVIIKTKPLDFTKNYLVRYQDEEMYVTLGRELLSHKKFIYDGDDLGAVLRKDRTVSFKLFSPSATAVKLLIYQPGDSSKLLATLPLSRGDKGVWQRKVDHTQLPGKIRDLEGLAYQYEVSAYGQKKIALDPYAKSMAAFAGDYKPHDGDKIGKGVIIDLERSDKTGLTRRQTNRSIMANTVDLIAYEIHVRDFTIGASDVPAALQGTYRGFIEKIPYLKELGITHVQLLPIHNQYRVDEADRSFQDKNTKNPNYNWGYDPHNYFTPEGWYSSNPQDPYARIKEFRELVAALHAAGIGVILDVVYNHTFSMSVLDNAAPGVYYRVSKGPYPVSDPALESRNPMTRKLIIDSLKHYVDYFGVDGFRFDLLGFIDTQTVRAVRSELGKDIILQGEAWNFTDLPVSEAPIKGIYDSYPHDINLAAFNDTSRDAYAGRMADKGFLQGEYYMAPRCRAGLMGGLKEFDNQGVYASIDDDDYNRFAASPEETLQYLAIHDGFTLWDKINLSTGGSPERRAALVKQALAMLFTSQGKLILHGGDEMGRTKPLDPADPEPARAHTSEVQATDNDLIGVTHFHENSYRSSDYTNMLRWDRLDIPHFADIHDYTKGLIAMRRALPGLRYAKAASIRKGLKFIGEAGGGVRYPKPIYSSFSEMPKLTIKFTGGPARESFYLAGEVHQGDHNPTEKNPYRIEFDEQGKAEITFTRDQIAAFDLVKWGATESLNIKLVRQMGGWDTIPAAYSGMGNNRIKPGAVLKGDEIVVDLTIMDHAPGEATPNLTPFIAYEIDNTVEGAGKLAKESFRHLIVVHNASERPVEVASDLIQNAAEWAVLLDENQAGATALAKSAVVLSTGKVIVPALSSAVIGGP